MKIFVFTTNSDKLTNPPLEVNEKLLGNFGEGRINIIYFSKSKGKPVELTISEEIIPTISPQKKPYFILINDSIHFSEKHHEFLNNLIPVHSEIYLTIHKTKPSNTLDTFKKLFHEQLKGWLYENHNNNTIYENVLKEGLCDNITNLVELENIALKHFPDPKRIFKTNLLHYCLGKGLIPNDIPEELENKINNQEVEFYSEIRKCLTKHKTDKTMNLLSEEFSEAMNNFKNDLKITVTN